MRGEETPPDWGKLKETKMIKDRNIANDAAINPTKLIGAGLGPNFGDVFWVCKSSLTAYTWLKSRVPQNRLFTTLGAADLKMVNNTNARCLIVPGHTESTATEISLVCAGAEYIGLGRGPLRPTFTCTGAVNVISLDADNQSLVNVAFAAPGIDHVEADIDVVGAGCQILNTWHQASGNTNMAKVDVLTLTATAHDTLVDGFRSYNTTAEVDGSSISIEGACSRPEIRNAIVMDTAGFALGALRDGAAAKDINIHHSYFSNAKADTVCVDFTNNSTGIVSHVFVNGRHTTIASNLVTGNAISWCEVRAVEQTALNAMLLPVIDAE